MFKYGLYRFLALVVRVAYLVALYSGVYLMFSRAHVTESSMGEVFTVTIAAAVLLHEFLQQSAFIALFRTFMRNQQNNGIKREVLFHGAVMLALTCFDGYCVWQLSPVALVLPALFFTSSLLVEADEDAGALLARQEHVMSLQTTRATVKQWRARMKRARKLAINLAPVGATLMRGAGNDAGADRITTIDEALTAAERTHAMPVVHGWLWNLFHGGAAPVSAPPYTRPPTGGGTPSTAPVAHAYEAPDPGRELMRVVGEWPHYPGVPLPSAITPNQSPVRTPAPPGILTSPTLPSIAAMSPVRTQDMPTRAEARNAAAESLRERRISAIIGYFRAADANGKRRPTVGHVMIRIARAPDLKGRRPISRSTVNVLMRQASERMEWEASREASAQVAQ